MKEEITMDNLNDFKIMLTTGLWALMGALGWQGVLFLAWVLLMALDYASGWLVAKKTKTWKSEKARDGIMHKGGMVLVVMAAGLADMVLGVAWEQLGLMDVEWPWLVLALVLMWYCLTEIGSILENAGKMGAPVPEWFAATLDAGLHIVDSKGEEVADLIAQDKREQEGIENG